MLSCIIGGLFAGTGVTSAFITPGAKLLVLGGQHSTQVLLEDYQEQTEKRHVNPESMDRPYREVVSQILREETPLHVRQWAAGFHQNKQRRTTATTFSEVVLNILNFLGNVAKNEINTPNTVTLSGDEIWDVVTMNTLPHDIVAMTEKTKQQICAQRGTEVSKLQKVEVDHQATV